MYYANCNNIVKQATKCNVCIISKETWRKLGISFPCNTSSDIKPPENLLILDSKKVQHNMHASCLQRIMGRSEE